MISVSFYLYGLFETSGKKKGHSSDNFQQPVIFYYYYYSYFLKLQSMRKIIFNNFSRKPTVQNLMYFFFKK